MSTVDVDVDGDGGSDVEAAPVTELHGCPVTSGPHGARVVHTDAARYRTAIEGLRKDGYTFAADLCAVDHLSTPGRPLPAGVEPQRYEVVVNLRDMTAKAVVRVRCQVAAEEPALPTLFDLFPGTEAMEREAFDMFGVRFDGHPDLTRILMPDDWEGHPLRKDYSIGRIPVQFKAARASR